MPIFSLAIIYLGIVCVSIIGIGNQNFYYFNHLGFIEFLSSVIFFSSLYLGNKSIKLYVVLLVFNILALPSSIDNFFPSVLISASTDLTSVYFPIVTHIDVYLLFGIIRFWDKKHLEKVVFNSFVVKVFFSLLFFLGISITINIIKYNTIYDIGLILSHSYHLRYFLLLLLLFANTSVIKYKRKIFLGICISVIFLIFESTIYSNFFKPSTRLVSGTLGNNVFANILSAIACYYIFLIIRKYLSIKYLFLLIPIIISIILTETRSALFLLLFYLFSESILYTIDLFKKKDNRKALCFLFPLLFTVTFIFFSQSERFYLRNFKVEKIDLMKTNLNEILVLEKNDFNASLILRLYHFQTSLNMIKDEPMVGIGTGRWNRYKENYGSTDNNVMDSHNDFLALASQYGIFSAVLLCFYIFFLPFLLYKRNNGENKNKNNISYLFIINIVMMFAGITNAALFKNQIFGLLALILMFYIFNITEETYEDSDTRNKRNPQ